MNTIRALLVLLATGGIASAAITATDRGTGTDAVSNTSIVVSPNANMAAGSTGVLMIAMSNSNAATTNLAATSYTDSVGNIWVVRAAKASGTANANAEVDYLTSQLTATFKTTDNLTLTLTTADAAKTWALIEASSNLTGGAVLTNSQDIANTAVATGVPSQTSTSLIQAGELVIGVCGAKSADTFAGDADTTNGSWSTMQHAGTGSAMSIITQTKVTTGGYATQSYDPTLTSASTRIGMVYLTECDAKTRALGGKSASESFTTIPITLPMAAGSIGVLVLSADNNGLNGNTANIPTSITDSKSNTWTLRQTGFEDPGVANAGVEIGIYTSVLTTPLVGSTTTNGDTLTATYITNVVVTKAWSIIEIAPTGAGTMSYVTGGVGTGQAAVTSFSLTTGSIANGDYVVAMVGSEADALNYTGDSDTTNGPWRAQGQRNIGAANNSGIIVATQLKKVTATATQSYDVTSAAAGDMNAAWVEINDSSVVASAGSKLPTHPAIPSL